MALRRRGCNGFLTEDVFVCSKGFEDYMQLEGDGEDEDDGCYVCSAQQGV